MKYISTRGKAPAVSFSEAILNGLAPDGGLYVPQEWPTFDPDEFDAEASFAALAARILEPFLSGDELQSALPRLCKDAFNFPMPRVDLDRGTSVLELFHGPTAAFKDFGARFLATCFEALLQRRDMALTVLVATSGDTGAAVAAACHRRLSIEVGVLFPDGAVAPRQAQQLTCWDGNVHSFAVDGSFDDCQRMVKAAFTREDWPEDSGLSSANSINVGRLLPQMAYYAISAIRFRHEFGRDPGFVVPSGNIGNSVGAFWARKIGFPVDRIALATNANRAVADWFTGGEWQPRASVRTLANAMDVGDPSNMERLFHLYPTREALRAAAQSLAVDDETIRMEIARGLERWGQVWCPHTATAVHLREQLPGEDWVIVATAHPAKFESIVEPLIGREVALPPQLAALLRRPNRVRRISADLEQMIEAMP